MKQDKDRAAVLDWLVARLEKGARGLKQIYLGAFETADQVARLEKNARGLKPPDVAVREQVAGSRVLRKARVD